MKDADRIVRKKLQQLVAKHGTQTAVAAALGVSTGHLSHLLNGGRGCSDAMLAKLGLRRTIIEKAS